MNHPSSAPEEALNSPRYPTRVSLSGVVKEVESQPRSKPTPVASAWAVAPAPRGVYVEADRQVLAAAVNKLVRNAFKHSRTHGHVSLSATVMADHVLIEIEDECGGLQPGETEELLRPLEEKDLDGPPPRPRPRHQPPLHRGDGRPDPSARRAWQGVRLHRRSAQAGVAMRPGAPAGSSGRRARSLVTRAASVRRNATCRDERAGAFGRKERSMVRCGDEARRLLSGSGRRA